MQILSWYCTNLDVMTGSTAADPDDAADSEERVERWFVCTACGDAMRHEVDRLHTTVQTICLDCGDWTTQTADVADLIDSTAAGQPDGQ